MTAPRILLVHAERSALGLLHSMLQSLGLPIDEAENDRAALKLLEKGTTSLVIAGIDPGDPDALELLNYVRRKQPKVPVILLFGAPHPERAKEANQRGASAILRFPVGAAQIRAAVSQALGVIESELGSQFTAANRAVAQYPTPVTAQAVPVATGQAFLPVSASETNGHAPANGHGSPMIVPAPAEPQGPRGSRSPILGEDACLRQAIELAETIAPTRASVLILGEPGSGKALLARALHQQSLRRDGPFVEVSCAHIKESVLEQEIFGRKASFTDPLGDRPGKIEIAQRGTLYLDEVAALSPELQYKLLRLIQDGEYEPVGSTQTVRADIRLILGSKENLPAWVEQGRMRQDLYGRISVVALKLPPLRHRGEDVLRLAEHFLERAAAALDRDVEGFTPEAQLALRMHGWPGNVEELENAVERAVILTRGVKIDSDAMMKAIQDTGIPQSRPGPTRPGPSRSIRPLKEALEEPEKRIILQALEALNWNRQETAKVLDINRTTLYKKMKKYNLLDDPAWVSN